MEQFCQKYKHYISEYKGFTIFFFFSYNNITIKLLCYAVINHTLSLEQNGEGCNISGNDLESLSGALYDKWISFRSLVIFSMNDDSRSDLFF